MAKAGSVAIELRRLADALDKQPESDIVSPHVSFYGYEKTSFLSLARLLPKPLTKRVTDAGNKWARLRVEYNNASIDVSASVPQSLTCELVEPAKPAVYRCEPILSDEEDAAMAVSE